MNERLGGIDDPVILLGRGGGGTRLLSELARGLGVFVGPSLNESGDSLDWVDGLYALAVESVGCGHSLSAARDLDWRDRLRATAAGVLEHAQDLPSGRWGWKLPETMLCLEVVLRAFPRAQVVHLVRHPVTSALRRTHVTSRRDNPVGAAVLQAAYVASGMDPERIETDESFIHNAVSWNYQLRHVLGALRTAGAAALQVRYEDLCASPRQVQRVVADFIGVEVAADALVCAIDEARMNAADLADTRTGRVWELCGETARALGYDRQPPGTVVLAEAPAQT